MKILGLTLKNSKKIIKTTIKSIKKGKVTICPTDTVYGLICDATNKTAVKKLFEIKKRPKGKPIPIFVKNIAMAKKYAKINKEQENFLKKIWPGKFTIIFKSKNKLPNLILGKGKTIGLRIPNYKLLNEILNNLNFPLTGTSANISGQSATTKMKEVLKQFKNQKLQPDLGVNAGDLKPSKPSTVIDLSGSTKKTLREGNI